MLALLNFILALRSINHLFIYSSTSYTQKLKHSTQRYLAIYCLKSTKVKQSVIFFISRNNGY